jgi:hypothetical protein
LLENQIPLTGDNQSVDFLFHRKRNICVEARGDSVSVEYQGEFPGPKEKATRCNCRIIVSALWF